MLVVDASVAFKWFLADEPFGAEALAVLRKDVALIAPEIVVAEVCNAAWRSARLGRISESQADEIARFLPRLFDELIGTAAFAPRAVAVAFELGHPVYDCFYLVIADARQTNLVTADTRLLARLAGTRWSAMALHLSDAAIHS
jgi:predicted nucleic acid-binding protein